MNASLTTENRIRAARALVLAGSALGALMVPMGAQAQNLSVSTNGDYALSETGTRSGGPRTVDVTTTSGDITLGFGTVETVNDTTYGAGIAATNTGSGNITIAADAVTASGSASTYGIDARASGGNIVITSGTIESSSNPSSRGIHAVAGGGSITITADVTHGGQRGIFTSSNNGVFPDAVTITSNVATASGLTSPNAIVAQGEAVTVTSGIARNTNADAVSGTAIFVNSGTGGAIVHAGTTEALGNGQAGIWAYSDGAVAIDSDLVNITGNSWGFNIQGATDLLIDSGTVTSTGAFGAAAVYITGVTSRSAITSGTISTTGTNSAGIWFDRSGGDIAIDSGAITTAGTFSHAIDIVGATGNVEIASDAIATTGDFSRGISVDSSGAVDIASTAIAAEGAGSSAIYVRSGSAIDVASDHATAGAGAIGIDLSNRGGTGTLTLTSGELLGATYGIAAYGAGTTTVDSGTITLAGDSTPAAPGYGINVRSASGAVSVTSGTINGLADGASFGIDARVTGANGATITSGSISAYGNGGFGIHGASEAGALTIVSTGAITTTGATASDLVDTGAIDPATAPRETRAAHGIWATSTTGAITIESASVETAGVGAQGIWAQSGDGDVTIDAGTTITTATGYDAANGGTQDAVFGYASGSGAVTVVSNHAETAGDYATAVGAVGGGEVNITSNVARSSGMQLATVYGSSRNSDVTITSTDSSATGAGAYAVEGHAANGDLTITSGTASAEHGVAVYGTSGRLTTINAESAVAHDVGGVGVLANGSSVVLNIGSASSDGDRVVIDPALGVVSRADAVLAQAFTGTLDATIGSATATGAGSDAVHLAAQDTVTARITGAVRATRGTGLAIEPYGDAEVTIAAGGSIAGLTGIDFNGSGANTIVNAGSIAGTTGPAILTRGPTLLDNSGVLTGGTGAIAVQLGASDDRVILRTGSSVTGAIVGGGGTDTAVLVGTGNAPSASQTIAAFQGFDSLAVESGYWTAGSTTSVFNRAMIAEGASLELANGASGIAGISAPSIVADGTLVVRSGADAGATTFGSSIVTGNGGVRFTGSGIATLDGNNSLANTGVNRIDAGATVLVTGTQGGSFVNNGTFQIGAGGTIGDFTGDLVDNGTLIVNRSDAYTFSGVLSGSGIFIKEGDGTITFGTGYAFTGTTVLNGGAIRLSGPVAATTELAVEGNGTIDLSGTNQTVAELAGSSATAGVNIDGGSLTVDQDSDTSFAGTLSGDGAFTKTGSGSLNLTGTNTYTGGTSVDGGRLAVNGSIVSPLTVNSGGTLGGTGTLGDTTIAAGGTWAPGNSIGTQTVQGDLTFAQGSVFAVEVDAAGNADRIDATGTATIEGGTVQVLAGSGNYAQLTNYTILTAAGGVTGEFDAVTSNLAFLSPFLNYAGDRVTLSLVRNDFSFASAATSANQRAVAEAVNARGFRDALYDTVLVQSSESARATFDALSGELHAALGSELIDGGRRVRDAVLARGLNGGDGIGMWAQALQVQAGSRTQAGLAKVSSNRTGVVGGVDYGVGNLRFGINGGYVDADVTLGARASNADVRTRLAGASLAWQPAGPIAVQVGGNYAWHDIDTRRVIGVAGIAGTLTGETDAHSAQLFGEAEYDLIDGALDLGLFARVSHDWTGLDGLAEAGGVAALTIESDSRETSSVSAGVRLGGTAPVAAGLSMEPRFSLAYSRNWGDLAGNRDVRFGTGADFGISGARLGKDALDVDLGLDLVTDGGLRFGIGGFANTSRDWADYGAKASISLRF